MGDSGHEEEFHDAEEVDMMTVRVRVQHATRRYNAKTLNGEFDIMVKSDGSDTVLQVKEKIAAASKSGIDPATLLIEFGPNDTIVGVRHAKDTERADSELTMKDYATVLHWLHEFPDWSLVCRFLPAAPSPPGEAATRAAAIAEGATDNGDEAVATARRDGVIPAIESS